MDGVGMDHGGILVPLDGSPDVAEGLGDLSTFPVATANGMIGYPMQVAARDVALNGGGGFGDPSLANHAIVPHGLEVDGEYVATLPVACGCRRPTRCRRRSASGAAASGGVSPLPDRNAEGGPEPAFRASRSGAPTA